MKFKPLEKKNIINKEMMHGGEDDEWEMHLVVMVGIWSKYKSNNLMILKCYAIYLENSDELL